MVDRHLSNLENDMLVDVYRHWAGDIGVPTSNSNLVRRELQRLMTDQTRVLQRYRELPVKCRDFVAWMLEQQDYALPLSRLDDETDELPVRSLEVESITFTLKKRGFLAESRDRSWMHYNEPLFRIPTELGNVLEGLLRGADRSLESQISLRAFLRTVRKDVLVERLRRIGLPAPLADDRSALISEFAKPEAVERALSSLGDPELAEAVTAAIYDHGGIIEARHLARLGFEVEDVESWRGALEESLLGTLTTGELSDVGLRMGPGSLVVFLELTRGLLLSGMELIPEEEPEPPADSLADLAAIRTYLDHRSVRVTREGTLYRTTRKKMEGEILSPGARPVSKEDALSFLLRFMGDAELVNRDGQGRLRVTADWKDFESRGPVERTDLLLTYVQNDTRGSKGEFHQQRLRRNFLSVLRDAGPSRWLNLKGLAQLARNRYLLTMDRATLADRFQKRYKYAPVPPLAGPAALVRELVQFGSEALALVGVLEVLDDPELAPGLRLTRMGAAVLGLPVDNELGDDQGALIVTADFEIILFPEAGGIDLVHEIGRFSRRERADYSLHYRVTQRTIQEAVAQGLKAEDILRVLHDNGRHEVPQNVAASIAHWALSVRILEPRRTMLIKAPSPEALDAALKVREVRSVVVERLNETTAELSEDPSNNKIAEALRTAGFFLR